MLDLKITGGTIIDGSGAPGYRGDVAIARGRIVALGKVSQAARETINADGLVVSPGFIDVHTHYDAQAFWDPTLSPSCYHGVTTVFGGFCGFSIAPMSKEAAGYLMPMLARVEGMPLESLAAGVPWDWTTFGEFLGRLEGRLAINAGFMAGHSAIRRVVMGPRAVGEQATQQELEAMKQLLRESLRDGAFGLSSTLSPTHNDADGNPVPSRFATREELLGLATVVSEFDGTTAELLPATDFDQNTYEVMTQFSVATQRPVNWNVLVLMSLDESDRAAVKHKLGASDYAREHGGEVIALTIPQTPTLRVSLYSGFVFDALLGWAPLFRLPIEERIEKLKDPAYRRMLKEKAAETGQALAYVADWSGLSVVESFSKENQPYVGRRVGQIAVDKGAADPFDVFIDIALADGLKTLFMPRTQEDNISLIRERAKLWLDDRTVVGGSDAGAHLDMIDTFAFSTYLLEHGVRRYEVITLEQAVHQLTEKPARMYGLKERGLLKAGWYADLVVFDPQEVGRGPVYTRNDMPAGSGRLYAEAQGIHNIIVNGKEIIRNGRYLGSPAGSIIRPGRDTETVRIAAARAR